jgi:hypothetical protein
VLNTNDLNAYDYDTKLNTKLNGVNYLDVFIDGFIQGEQYFESEFKPATNILYGPNAEQIITNLHNNYFHTWHTNMVQGWVWVKHNCPFIITNNVVKEFGYFSGIVSKVEELINQHTTIFAKFDKCEHVKALQTIDEPEFEHQPILKNNFDSAKPIIKPEFVNQVYDILKDFFTAEQQPELKKILESGENVTHHLIFMDNGNRLADAFKQLIKADLITGCMQNELEQWIASNFKYRHNSMLKEFKKRYLNDIISSNKDKCAKPLLNVRKERGTDKIIITKTY